MLDTLAWKLTKKLSCLLEGNLKLATNSSDRIAAETKRKSERGGER